MVIIGWVRVGGIKIISFNFFFFNKKRVSYKRELMYVNCKNCGKYKIIRKKRKLFCMRFF